ncbi:MAG: aminotransferase class I/II-fold pyridoxal phosphate-dependent enzyme [Candidatus Aminicenantes bacterium]|nr:aminotransferase class I/II-fold pyridoxal phosphate-dependent enzyme [Candidatus Aminicenantes bacterium]
MKIEIFKLERMQSTWENEVEYNLAESGVHPLSLRDFLGKKELESILGLGLGYSQTNGTPGLRKNIAAFYPGIAADQIQATAGSTEANFLLMWSLIERGDEVVFEVPNYMQMWGLLRGFGAKVKTFRLREERNWAPDLDALARAVTKATKLIILTNPNNPTGAVLDEDEMEEIVRIARKADAWILADEVYQGAERVGPRTPSFWGRYKKVICVNGMSKAYGLAGLRLGWIAAPLKLIQSVWPHHDYTTICPSVLSDKLAEIALSPAHREKILRRTRAVLNANYPILETWLKKHRGVFRFTPPRAGAIAFVRYGLPIPSTRLCERFIREQSVFLVPGDLFEMDRFLRIGFGAEGQKLRIALARVEKTLRKIV